MLIRRLTVLRLSYNLVQEGGRYRLYPSDLLFAVHIGFGPPPVNVHRFLFPQLIADSIAISGV